MQTHQAAILSLVTDANMRVRRSAVALVGVILRQGLVLPAQLVPALVAATADVDKPTAETAVGLLGEVVAKNPMFVTSKFVEGLKKLQYLAQNVFHGQCMHPEYMQYLSANCAGSLENTARVYAKIRDAGKQHRVQVFNYIFTVFPDPTLADKVLFDEYHV